MTAAIRSRRRVVAAVSALLAALVLALLPLPPATTSAAAADGTAEDSAVTVTGRKGANDDFSRLKVTVHQTRNLRSQGVRIGWEGGAPTSAGNFAYNYLQIMQCWGDDPAGPTREQCVLGATDTSDAVVPGYFTTSRGVDTQSGSYAADPGETQYTGANAFVPFKPVGGLPPTTSVKDPTYFGPLDTNEQVANRTFADGRGEVTFEVQDALEAPHLGCGVNTAPAGGTPAPRSCWLVIVPRGTHDADGTNVLDPGGSRSHNLTSSPLSATNWAQRMVVRLDFLPSEDYCPQGQPERPTAGSELVTDAVTSWQPKLCSSTGSTFAFTQGGEEEARNQVLGTSDDSPLLGFTVDPVARPEDGPEVVHAPVAVSGLAIAFFIEGPSGVVQGMRLTPRLVAKMLTHSYVDDVTLGATPDHVNGNSASLTEDPEFKDLNPDFPELSGRQLRSLMVPLQTSDTTRVVWNWLQSDKDARDFLSGTKDPWGMRVNSYFQKLKLATDTSLTDYPKVDPTTTPALGNGTPPLDYTITDLDPFTADLHDGAVRTRRGNNNRTIQWQPGETTQSPAKLINDAPMSGQRAVMAIVDTASAERYGLTTAALRNAGGQFVKPTADTLAADVATMRPASGDPTVLTPDPSRAKGQAYPLTAVAYAAASVNQDAKARKAYAEFIRYVAGQGQTPGLSAGQLPPGYAPLPTRQREQAETAADALERGRSAGGPPSDGSGAGDTGGLAPGAGDGGTSGGADTGGAAAGGTGGPGGPGGAGAGPSATESAAAVNGSAPPSPTPRRNIAEAKVGFTPGEILGIVRWVLLTALFVGGAAGLSGPIMLHFARRRTP
ncbi:hypothetical protein [Streptomyces sp. NPDC059466]|uniref:hypothetical protein n=1 Tax=unclassified Streptomyces TaxID=2593676 RepID=UPI00369F7ABC